MCCIFSSACAKIEALASPLQARPPPGQGRTQPPVLPGHQCLYQARRVCLGCATLWGQLCGLCCLTVSQCRAQLGTWCCQELREVPTVLPGPVHLCSCGLSGVCHWLWGGQGAGQPGCVGLGRAAGPRPCKGGWGLMWEEDSGSDLLSFAREMAPAMVWCHSMAERAAGSHRPWRWL